MLTIRPATLTCICAAFSLFSLGTTQAEENVAASASEARLLDSVKYLASDELEGRGPGTAGIEKAAAFIAEQLAAAGLKTDILDGAPFQPFELAADAELGEKENNQLILIGPPTAGGSEPQRIVLKLGEQFNTLALGGSGEVTAPLVFVGYGISAEDPDYDEYQGVDVKGKIVVMLRREPQQGDADSAFNGTRSSRHAYFTTKVENAVQHEAAAVIIVNDEFSLLQSKQTTQERFREEVKKLVELRVGFRKQKDPSSEQLAEHLQQLDASVNQVQALSERVDAAQDRIVSLREAGQSAKYLETPVYFCKREAIEPLVTAALGSSLAEIEQRIDQDLKPQSAALEQWSAECKAEVVRNKITVKNVIGVLEGAGELANETIIVGAHYDHLGKGSSGSLAPWTSAIHNGADDNASGTSAVLEIARRITARAEKNRRRIVFMAFAGEERGLLGSKHYVKQPVFPLEQTVAMVNLDMVGRLTDNKLEIHGTGTATGFDAMIDQFNEKHGFELSKIPSGYGPSDHATFYAQKIPVFHFFTNLHSDYHRPSDDYDKVNVTGMRRIVDYVADVVVWLDELENRPEYKQVQRQRRRRRRP